MRYQCVARSNRFIPTILTTVAALGILAGLSFAFVATTESAFADDEPAASQEPVEGRLWNLTPQPFTLRMRRRDGSAWTNPITIQPGKYLAIRPGGDSDLEGITGKGDGHVSVEYAELGGKIRLQLPAQTQSGQLVPYWFAVKDSNGFTRLIQAADVDVAKERQTELQAEPKLTPQELANVKKMLKANWVLFD